MSRYRNNNLLIIALFILSLVALLCGCSTVKSNCLIGDRITANLTDQFDGIWEYEDTIAYMKYLQNGELRIAGAEWRDKNFKLEEMSVILTKCGDKNFANYSDPSSSDQNETNNLFFCYSFLSDNLLAVWEPKIEVFEEYIQSGSLKGEVIRHQKQDEKSYYTNIYLKETSESLCQFFQKEQITKFFDLEKPKIYRRISKQI